MGCISSTPAHEAPFDVVVRGRCAHGGRPRARGARAGAKCARAVRAAVAVAVAVAVASD